jgi:hypothetical protein
LPVSTQLSLWFALALQNMLLHVDLLYHHVVVCPPGERILNPLGNTEAEKD